MVSHNVAIIVIPPREYNYVSQDLKLLSTTVNSVDEIKIMNQIRGNGRRMILAYCFSKTSLCVSNIFSKLICYCSNIT